jgi:(2Fe-2S) ferredoxin
LYRIIRHSGSGIGGFLTASFRTGATTAGNFFDPGNCLATCKVNPDLVVRDSDGKAFTVRYEAVNAMLLNEFLKEHRKGEEQDRKIEALEATVTKLQSVLKEQAAQIQKVSAQLN